MIEARPVKSKLPENILQKKVHYLGFIIVFLVAKGALWYLHYRFLTNIFFKRKGNSVPGCYHV